MVVGINVVPGSVGLGELGWLVGVGVVGTWVGVGVVGDGEGEEVGAGVGRAADLPFYASF